MVSGEEVVHAQWYTADVSNMIYSLFQEADASSKSLSVIVDAGANICVLYPFFSCLWLRRNRLRISAKGMHIVAHVSHSE
jgi:hypothetical protein